MPENTIERLRVLLVEDDQEMAICLAILLRAAGYQVEMVFDGETALETAEAFHPDICLVNVNVPQLNGYDLTRRLRERFERPPLFANVTPFNERDDWDADAEFDIDFTKPSDPFVVVDQLSDFLRLDATELRSKRHNFITREKPRMPESRRVAICR